MIYRAVPFLLNPSNTDQRQTGKLPTMVLWVGHGLLD